MPRRTSTRRRRRPRNSMPRRQSRRAFNVKSVLPPAKSIWGHILRNVTQTIIDIAQGPLVGLPHLQGQANPITYSSDLNIQAILSSDWVNRYKGLFSQYKVHKITAHFMPYAPPNEPGEYIFTLSDASENTETLNTFSKAIGSPASVVRKTGQPAKLVWRPTEPDDRNWHNFADNHVWCKLTLNAAESNYHTNPDEGKAGTTYATSGSIAGKVICEVEASYRGKPPAPTSAYHAPCDSLEYAQYSASHQCTCRRCIKKQLNDIRAQAQSDMDLEIVG